MRLKQLEKYNYNKYIHDLSMILSKKTTRDIMNVLKAILKYTNSKYHTDVFIQDIILPKLEVSSLNILNKKEISRKAGIININKIELLAYYKIMKGVYFYGL